MIKRFSPVFLLAATICLGGASCHDQKEEENLQNKQTMEGSPARTGTGIIPRQQIQPRMNRM
ncbi:hypothetical protein [Pseudomonas fluorescens]|uniref:hypothetical protein n=1 Tax=Pseudomonas fluorescens TaxID=294 RepID=UPI001241CB35|nr:hypothetical protein [Pseudomonas fluorescens]VVP41461.1 hypothetical protein PS898_04843 [Pseudomonas fluorescens]